MVKKNILFLRMVQFNEKIGPGGGVKKIGREDGGPKRFGGKRGGGHNEFGHKKLCYKNGPIERQNWSGEELTWSKHVQLEAYQTHTSS